jgi:group I intron endonuclease
MGLVTSVLYDCNAMNDVLGYNVVTTKRMPRSAVNTRGNGQPVKEVTMSSIPRASGIYKIVCTSTGKVYIGSSTDLRGRKSDHWSALRRGDHRNRMLQSAWNKYGENAFTYEVLELVLVSFLLEREQYWIDRLRCCDRRKGFNLSPTAGSTLGKRHSLETRRKQSEVKKGKGDPLSPEARRLVAEKNTGKKRSIETRQKIAESNRRRVYSLETRQKIAEANRNRPPYKLSAEACLERSERLKGKPRPPEVMAKVAAANRGRKRSEESRRKQSETLKGRKPSKSMMQASFNAVAKRWILTDPEGNEYHVTGLSVFCREYGLSYSKMFYIASGKAKKERGGWKCRRADYG